VLLVEVAVSLVPEALDRLQQGLRAAMAARQWPVSFSIGAITFTSPPPSPDEVLRAADEVMYVVKRGSKNAVRHETRA
jgi:GGDEF domain-containing protein